jgi:hypothetical protein
MARCARGPPLGITGTAVAGTGAAGTERCNVPGPAGPKTSWRT